jgi:hypothetical protein
VDVYEYMWMYMNICISMYMCKCMCMCIYMYRALDTINHVENPFSKMRIFKNRFQFLKFWAIISRKKEFQNFFFFVRFWAKFRHRKISCENNYRVNLTIEFTV